MLVVVAVVLVVLGLALPAASTLWKERKESQAQNAIEGLLMTTRARAMLGDGADTGFLAFLDSEGSQHLVSIQQSTPPPAGAGPPLWTAWQNVFRILEDRDVVLPAPMRIVPRYVVEDVNTNPQGTSPPSFELFSNDELANDNFETPSAGQWDQKQRHRNFFTMIYTPTGQLAVHRDVLIQETAESEEQGTGNARRGARTGLGIGPGFGSDPPTTARYYHVGDSGPVQPNQPAAFDDFNTTMPGLVVDDRDVALNFPSVDGLLVYDESLLRSVAKPEKRDFLLRTAQPLYISRWTGSVIRGPVGEAQ